MANFVAFAALVKAGLSQAQSSQVLEELVIAPYECPNCLHSVHGQLLCNKRIDFGMKCDCITPVPEDYAWMLGEGRDW